MARLRRPSLRHLALAAALGGLLLAGLRCRRAAPSEEALLAGTPARPPERAPARAPVKNAASSAPPRRPAAPRGGEGEAPAPQDDSGLDPREIARGRLERARRALDGYVQSTRYPPGSRPLSEHPDLVRAHSVPTTTQPLAREDGKLTDARVTLEQDRYFLVGDEAARLTVACATSEGPAACEVALAEARAAPTMPEAADLPAVAVAFHDDGRDGDAAAGDGAPTALFAPAREGFGGYHGPLGVELLLRVDGEEGTARFELQYTPAAPARFTGEVREALEDGSLCLYVGMDVDSPGRYVLTARADAAGGEGFAYLQFNDTVGAGRREAKMCLFGKLVLDEHARSPFVLRDLEGFLLLEDAYPDREIMPALAGPVYTTKAYDDSRFSGAEWQSEERRRHVDELTKDVAEAERDLARAEGGGP